jgi:hypothetical protein
MADNIPDVTISIGPISISIDGLLRRFFGDKMNGPTKIVGQRFLQVFGAHGVAATQIPRLLPQVQLDKLNSGEALLGALTNDVLDATAMLFDVRREWLDGVCDELYPSYTCYKRPQRLFEDLENIGQDGSTFPVRALFSSKSLDATSRQTQPVVLLLCKRIAELGDADIFKYKVYSDSWDWGYTPARIQLKAIARLVHQRLECPVPLYRVDPKTLERVRTGRLVPRDCIKGSLLTEPSLEDFGLSPEESVKSAESEELPAVLAYIKELKLTLD